MSGKAEKALARIGKQVGKWVDRGIVLGQQGANGAYDFLVNESSRQNNKKASDDDLIDLWDLSQKSNLHAPGNKEKLKEALRARGMSMNEFENEILPHYRKIG